MIKHFTYEHKLELGNGKTAMYELDCQFEIERDESFSIYVYCYDLRNYEPVNNQTDLYNELMEYIKKAFDVEEILDEHARDVLEHDKQSARM